MASSPYTDLRRPPLRSEALRESLVAPAGPLARLEVLEEVGSTNADLAARAAAEGADAWPHLSAVTADHQSAGRGRLGRDWVSPPRSGVAVSVLLRPAELGIAAERWSWLPLLAGLSTVSVLRRVAGVEASLKWPNDVLVDPSESQARPGKVAGILTEAPPAGGVVVGIGLNVSLGADELPVPAATSLALAGSATTDRDVLLRALLRQLAEDVARWSRAGGDAVASGTAARVREACSTLGRDVAVDLPGGERVTGVAEGVDGAGRLLLRVPGRDGGDGHLVPLAAGDVVHLR